MCLINPERNAKILEKVPHRELLDLSIIYKRVTIKKYGPPSFLTIDNEMMKTMGLTEKDLYYLGKKNTGKLLLPNTVELVPDFYIVSNHYSQFGAITVFETKIIEALANQYKKNLFIIPSSIHEMIVIPEQEKNEKFIKNIIHNENRTSLTSEEVLSDSLYCFDYKEKKFAIAE